MILLRRGYAVLALRAVILSCEAFGVAGCAHGAQPITPEQGIALLGAFRDAGCSGRASIDAGAGTGQVGGEAHIAVSASGECDPANTGPKPVNTP